MHLNNLGGKILHNPASEPASRFQQLTVWLTFCSFEAKECQYNPWFNVVYNVLLELDDVNNTGFSYRMSQEACNEMLF